MIYHKNNGSILFVGFLSLFLLLSGLFFPKLSMFMRIFSLFGSVTFISMFLLDAVLVDDKGIYLGYALGQKKLHMSKFISWTDVYSVYVRKPKRDLFGIRFFWVVSKDFKGGTAFSKKVVLISNAYSNFKKIIDEILTRAPQVILSDEVKKYMESVD